MPWLSCTGGCRIFSETGAGALVFERKYSLKVT